MMLTGVLFIKLVVSKNILDWTLQTTSLTCQTEHSTPWRRPGDWPASRNLSQNSSSCLTSCATMKVR